MIRVLFVCLGNICRSPTAEGVLRARLAREGLSEQVTVDSCGVGDYHIGEPPDERAIREAASRGIAIDSLVARRLRRDDFQRFDYLLAMDAANLTALEAEKTPASTARIALLMDFAATSAITEIPDPWFGGEDGFTRVYELIEAACDGFIAHLRRHHAL